jgi:hypothetical protein
MDSIICGLTFSSFVVSMVIKTCHEERQNYILKEEMTASRLESQKNN